MNCNIKVCRKDVVKIRIVLNLPVKLKKSKNCTDRNFRRMMRTQIIVTGIVATQAVLQGT